MSRKASTFRLGLFVILGVTIAMGTMLYLTASSYYDDADSYVTFFSESVQGLQRDSVVKYLGVSVGRVIDIRVAPDYNLIEVVMSIKFEGDLPRTMVAQLRSAGITGITFIELTRRQPADKDQSPKIDFAAEYPIIPSKPSEITQIVSTIEKVSRQFSEANFKGIFHKIEQISINLETLSGDPRLARSLANLEASTKELKTLTQNANRRLKQVDIKGVMGLTKGSLEQAKLMMTQGKELMMDSRRLVEHADKMLALLDKQVKDMHLPGISVQVSELIAGLKSHGDDLNSELMTTTQNMRRVTQVMEALVKRLEEKPSDILFSGPRPPRKVE